MKKYNVEFKSMVVELYKTGRSVKELSREYGVSEVTIYKWGPHCFNPPLLGNGLNKFLLLPQ